MRVCYVFILILSLPTSNYSQSLVLNPSFESFSICPFGFGLFDLAENWSVPDALGSPELYNSCVNPGLLGVPGNGFGSQQPISGNGYAGLVLFHPTANFREYIQGELQSPLIAGSTYIVSLWLSLADISPCAVSNFGVFFSNSQIGPDANLPTPLPFNPQLRNLTSPLTNKLDWEKLEWSYIANGGEKFILLGNFDNDDQSLPNITIIDSNIVCSSYYYIENISVSSDITETNNLTNDNEIIVFPNPAIICTWIDIELKNEKNVKITIRNSLGQIVNYKDLGHIRSKKLKLNLNDFNSGMYLIEFKIENDYFFEKLIITN